MRLQEKSFHLLRTVDNSILYYETYTLLWKNRRSWIIHCTSYSLFENVDASDDVNAANYIHTVQMFEDNWIVSSGQVFYEFFKSSWRILYSAMSSSPIYLFANSSSHDYFYRWFLSNFYRCEKLARIHVNFHYHHVCVTKLFIVTKIITNVILCDILVWVCVGVRDTRAYTHPPPHTHTHTHKYVVS